MAAVVLTTEDFGPHSVLKKIVLNDVDLASVGANTTAEQDIALPTGTMLATDVPMAFIKPAAEAGLGIVNVRCKAADVLAVTFTNPTGSAIDDAEEDGYVLVLLRG